MTRGEIAFCRFRVPFGNENCIWGMRITSWNEISIPGLNFFVRE
jgi:hypothetical protein